MFYIQSTQSLSNFVFFKSFSLNKIEEKNDKNQVLKLIFSDFDKKEKFIIKTKQFQIYNEATSIFNDSKNVRINSFFLFVFNMFFF
jgi:hypothetical protein